MSDQSFFSLSRKRLLTLYPEIIKNSDKQYEAALAIAKTGNPGIAIPHLLISSEELIKALVIILDAKGFKLRTVRGMDIFFKQHEIRFFISALIFAFSLFGDDMIKWLSTLKKDPIYVTNLIKDIISNEKSKENFFKWYMGRKFIRIKDEVKWFSQAEIFRQNGFYVDMKGALISPLKITDIEFEETKHRIEKVNKVTKYIIDTFTSDDPNMIKQIEEMKQNFETEGYYTLIENALEKVRKEKKSFFDGIITNVFIPLSDRAERKSMRKFNELIERSKNREDK